MFSVVRVCAILFRGHPQVTTVNDAIGQSQITWDTHPSPSPLLYNAPPPTHRHVQTCSLCSPDCRQAGGWHSTEMPSCI